MRALQGYWAAGAYVRIRHGCFRLNHTFYDGLTDNTQSMSSRGGLGRDHTLFSAADVKRDQGAVVGVTTVTVTLWCFLVLP